MNLPKRTIEIEVDGEVFLDLMRDCKGDEKEVKKQLASDIDFIYNYYRQLRNHEKPKPKKESTDTTSGTVSDDC